MKLSIIIPAYNVEMYISNTLYSLINQTNNDFEIIIINDGSTDGTKTKVENIFLENKFNDYRIINKENGGVSSARNRGIIESTGDYIFFLDGDDYVESVLVEDIYNYIKNYEPDIICWGFDVVNEYKTIISNYFDNYEYEKLIISGIDALKKIIIDNEMWIWTGSAIYSKKLILDNNLKYTEGCTNGEDQEFTFKALSNAKSVVFIDKILSYYLQRSSSVSNSYNIKRFDSINAMLRVSEYMNNKDGTIDEHIRTSIRSKNIIYNYFYNFNSCLDALKSELNYSQKKSIKLIIDDINRNYPNMNNYIKKSLNYNNISIKEKVKYKIFLFAPTIYFNIVNLKHVIKSKIDKIDV